MAAQLCGRHAECVEALQRAFHATFAAGDRADACRCAFHLGMLFTEVGEHAPRLGLGRAAQRLLEEIGADTLERGYVAHLLMFRHIWSRTTIPRPSRTPTRCTGHRPPLRRPRPDSRSGSRPQGRLALYSGGCTEGLALFDEAMAAVAAGEVSPLFAGHVYCVMIEGCQEVSDLGRAAAWTSALSRWARRSPALVAFTGQCAVHRGQILRLHGAFREAVDEFDARHRALPGRDHDGSRRAGLRRAGRRAAHPRRARRGRGELRARGRPRLRAAARPRPALAGPGPRRGRRGRDAPAARGEARPRRPVQAAARRGRRSCWPRARRPTPARLPRELEEIARGFGSEALRAAAAYAAGAVELAERRPLRGAALPAQGCGGLGRSPGAVRGRRGPRSRSARCLRDLGDEESATRELAAAQQDLPRARRRAGRARGWTRC